MKVSAALTYATVGSNDVERAKQFYDALFDSIGVGVLWRHPNGGSVYGVSPEQWYFGIIGPLDDQPMRPASWPAVGIKLDSIEAVDFLHAKALALGAAEKFGPPAKRGPKELGYYASYIEDLDGNILCLHYLDPVLPWPGPDGLQPWY